MSARSRLAIVGCAIVTVLLFEFDSAYADLKTDALTFVTARFVEIETANRCLNYESLAAWRQKGKDFQEWERVRSSDSTICTYSGRTTNRDLLIADPLAWQKGQGRQIAESDFYATNVYNKKYRARVVNKGRFEEGGSKSLGMVERTTAVERPFALQAILGEAIVDARLAEFINAPATTVMAVEDSFLNGKACKRLVLEGVLPRSRPANENQTPRHRCEWYLDAATGLCYRVSWKPVFGSGFEGMYSLEYARTVGDNLIPSKLTVESILPRAVRTTYFRRWNTDCLMDPAESSLSYHGIAEPDIASSVGSWLLWANAGVILLLAAWVLRRWHHSRVTVDSSPAT